MQAVAALEEALRSARQGPAPVFTLLHVLKLLLLLGSSGPRGRGSLAGDIYLGEGSVRTLVKRLQRSKLVTFTRFGVALSSRGMKLFEKLSTSISLLGEASAPGLSLDRYTFAALVVGGASRVSTGVRQRDEAVRNGATGATTLVYKNGRFRIPDSLEDAEAQSPSAKWRDLRGKTAVKEGDAIIICSAPTRERAELGTLAACLTLLGP